ncbi:MAG: tetratricopeptide repeat protein [Fimbriimonadaceae bacterium]|nr:tetratricopeptide repeat protein [Alphaproteobacteria bacterium]
MNRRNRSKYFPIAFAALAVPFLLLFSGIAPHKSTAVAADSDLPEFACAGLEETVHHEHKVVDSLLQRLKSAEDAETAAVLEEAILQAWIESGSETVDLLMSRTLTAMQQRDLPLALDLLNAIVELAPDYAEGWNKRATVLYLLDDYNHSLQDVHCTLALEPRHFGALSGLGLILMDIGNKERALEAFRRALDINPFLANAKRAVDRLTLEVEGREI